MESTAAFTGNRISIRVLVAVMALVLAFALGSASGYLVKAFTTPVTTTTPQLTVLPASTPKQTILPNQA